MNPKIAKEIREFNHLSKAEIDELLAAQEKIYSVIEPSARIATTPYQNYEAKHRRLKQPGFKMEKEIDQTMMRQEAT